MADFETVSPYTKYYEKHNDTKVMLYCLKSLDGSVKYMGISLKEFFKDLKSIKRRKAILIYFHNLSFDGDFILKWLDSNNFKGVNKLEEPNQFTVLRQNRNIYKIDVLLQTDDNKELYVSFHCSLKLLSSPVEALGKAIGVSKHNEDTQDANFYNLEPVKGLNEFPKAFVEYCERDVDIVRRSLIMFFENIDELCKNHWYIKRPNYSKVLTIGGLAYSFQTQFTDYFNLEHKEETDYISLKTDAKTHEIASKFYFGGFTQFNPNIQGQVIKCPNGQAHDVNSMYPSAMTQLLPYGSIYDFDVCEPPKDSIYLEYWELEIGSAISINGNFLCLANWNKLNGDNNSTKYRYVESLHNFRCYYLKEEFEALKKFYKFYNVKIIKRYWAKADYYLKPYINCFYKYKQDYSEKGMKAVANTFKILLNSSYGKHATRLTFDELYFCESEEKFKKLLELGIIEHNKKTGTVKEVNEIIKLANQFMLKFTPEQDKSLDNVFNKLIAATITAWSRIKLYNTLYEAGEENFLYCDTDSLYLKDIRPDNTIKFDNYELGAWKYEDSFKFFITKGAKAYVYGDNPNFKEHKKHTFSGVNKKWLAKNFDLAFYETEEIAMKEANLKVESCKSGLVLIWKDYQSKQRLH